MKAAMTWDSAEFKQSALRAIEEGSGDVDTLHAIAAARGLEMS